ncbi:MAG TPA: SDR family oxidoreductase [Kribbellaceae bacterium]|nr:SDR family oxidoreductase [Kribbellaceae bacterium]
MTKTILITGASSGLGAEMAVQFAALGYDLALCARRTDRLDDLKKQIANDHPGVRVEVKALDVNDHDAVFRVFREFADEFGTIDRVIVNAGLGKGQPLGRGRFDANRQTAETNFIGALAQTEAAAEIFRKQNAGHLVMVSSVSALRGMPGNITTYAATKAGVAHLAEGFRADVMRTPIKVTVLYPGYIQSEMSATSGKTPLMVSTEKGVRSMVRAIEKETPSARVPEWPWGPFGFALKHLPLKVARRLMG